MDISCFILTHINSVWSVQSSVDTAVQRQTINSNYFYLTANSDVVPRVPFNVMPSTSMSNPRKKGRQRCLTLTSQSPISLPLPVTARQHAFVLGKPALFQPPAHAHLTQLSNIILHLTSSSHYVLDHYQQICSVLTANHDPRKGQHASLRC